MKYYLDTNDGTLLAYERSVEFFVMYNQQTKEWVDCNISFSNFRHDYYFREVTKEQALKITDGNLPELMLQQYSDMIQKNSGV